jgi:hypothetical protein
MTDRTVEDRLADAFGAEMTPIQRAWVDGRVGTALSQSKGRRWRPFPRVSRILLLVGVLLILMPTALAVGVAYLGEAPYGLGDAALYEAEIRAAKAVTPIPPGATWPPYLERAPDPMGSYGVGLGRSMVEMSAACLWLGYWYTAHSQQDAAAMTAAVEVLEQTRHWRTFSDPLTAAESFRAHHNRVVDAAVAGDAATVLWDLELNCTGTWDGSR